MTPRGNNQINLECGTFHKSTSLVTSKSLCGRERKKLRHCSSLANAKKANSQMQCINESQLAPGLKMYVADFPGGAVVKNPPANAGDTG